MLGWGYQICVAVLLLGHSPENGVLAGETGWKKVFELPDSQGSLRTVWADADGWITAGAQIIVMNRNGRVVSTPEPGRTILGLASTRDGLFALGFDQVILRFDGNRWVEEHYSALPPTATRRQRVAAILQGAHVFGAGKEAATGAYGPWRVLLRRSDHSWVDPTEADRYRMNVLAEFGPEFPLPAACALAAWFWLDDREGWFTCHGGRSFRYNAGATTDTGKVPRTCHDGADGLAAIRKDLYLLCDGKIWKSSGERWDLVSGIKKVLAIAGNTHCLFAVTLGSVWQSCAEPSDRPEASKARK